MKKMFYMAIAAFSFCSVVLTNNVMAQGDNKFAGGTGTPEDPYLIATPEQFDKMRDERGASYQLVADLDFSKVKFDYEGGWWPIGEWGGGSGDAQRFHGTFDGKGHTIKNFYVEKPTGAHDMTFFGVVDGATIENVLFENITFIGEGRMGMISGQTERTIIRQVGAINCTVKNVGTGVEAGGFVGPGSQVQIYDCYFIDGSIYCKGKLSETDSRGDNAAALIGKAENTTAIMTSYTKADVVGNNSLGGIAGMIDASSSVSGCLAMCDITGNSDATGLGRVCGNGSPDLSSGNYALETVKINNELVTTENNSDQRNGANVTDADLTQEFFEELGFDFDSTWKMDSSISPYPVFQWQKSNGNNIEELNNALYKVYTTFGGVKVEGLKGGEIICTYNIAGMLLDKKVAQEGIAEVSLNENGAYIINVISGETVNTFKVAK